MLQIGARNMQNYQLLQAVGDSGKPALLKRGMSATLEEFLLAAEYILDRGNPNVMLCERGIRTYEDHTRFTLPLATVPYLHDKSHLPVVVDPSHGTGKARLVIPMARAAIAAGADAPDHRSPRRPRARRQRRRPDDHPRRIQATDGSVPADCGGGRSDGLSIEERHSQSQCKACTVPDRSGASSRQKHGQGCLNLAPPSRSHFGNRLRCLLASSDRFRRLAGLCGLRADWGFAAKRGERGESDKQGC